jgi:uncharacterized membrane protein
VRTQLLLAAMAATFLGPTLARAEAIKCVYTEPFVNTVFDPRSKTVTFTRMGEEKAVRFRVSVRETGDNLELIYRPEAFRQTMVKDGKGSDGMSDVVFPYSATLTKKGLPHRLHGGCR